VEDVGPLVIARCDGPEVFELVDRALDLVAALVHLLVERGRPAASAASASAVGPLVLRFGDGVLDLASAQVAPVPPGAVGLVAAEVVGAGAWAPAARSLDPDPFEHGDQLRAVAPLAGCDQQGQRSASAFAGEVDFAGQAAPGASESFVGAVLPRR